MAIVDQKEYLQSARTAVIELENWKETLDTVTAEEKKLDRELSGQRKAVADEIQSTVKKRRDELAETYDSQIRKEQEKLRAEKNKRAKEREKGVKNRMEEETASLVAQNSGLKTQIKELFSQKAVPGICNNGFFYALFFPGSLKEILIFALTALIWVAGIPGIIYALIPAAKRKPLHFILIAVAFLIVFVVVYIVINNLVKVRHYAPLKEGKLLRQKIASNKGRIARIKKGIRKDKNDEMYDLGEFDRNIAELESGIAGLEQQKADAINLFEQQTDPMIRQEIQENNRERLETLEGELNDRIARRRQAEDEIRSRTIAISQDYETVIGKENMAADKLDEILNIVDSENPANLTEAVQIYRSRGSKK